MKLLLVFVLSMMFIAAAESIVHCANTGAESTHQYDYYIDRDQIIERFYMLSKAGGLIESPKLPEEFYYNAKVYETRADLLNARRSYEEYLKFNLEFIDPVIDYLNILKVQESSENIISILTSFNKKSNPSIKMALALQRNNTNERIKELINVAEAFPYFVPVLYEVFDQGVKSTEVGIKNVEGKLQAVIYMKKTIEALKLGRLYSYYFDKRKGLEIQNSVNGMTAWANNSEQSFRTDIDRYYSNELKYNDWMTYRKHNLTAEQYDEYKIKMDYFRMQDDYSFICNFGYYTENLKNMGLSDSRIDKILFDDLNRRNQK